jgi:hypothetical protein
VWRACFEEALDLSWDRLLNESWMWTMLNSRSKMPKAVTIKNTAIWDVTDCSPTEINWCFRATCYLHLQGRMVNTVSHDKFIKFNINVSQRYQICMVWSHAISCMFTDKDTLTHSLKHLYTTCWGQARPGTALKQKEWRKS